MAKKNLRLLNIADFKLLPAQQRPTYVFVKANDEMMSDYPYVYGTFSNPPRTGFADLINKITMNIDQAN